MSYRYRLALVPHETVTAIRNLSCSDFVDWLQINNPEGYDATENMFCPWSLIGQNEIYDLGDCPFAQTIMKSSEPLFFNTDTSDATGDIRLLSKKNFLQIIDETRILIYNYFEKISTQSYDELKHQCKIKSRMWANISDVLGIAEINPEAQKIYSPYNIDENDDTIVNSWLWEYAIFELVRLYKTFDWSKNALIFYGW